MNTLLKILTYLSAYLSLTPFLKPVDRSYKTLLWVPKLLGGALSPIHTFICGIGALVGLVRKDWKLAVAGLVGAGFALKFIEEVPESQAQFEDAFGCDWAAKIPDGLAQKMLPERFSLPAKPPEKALFQKNISLGKKPNREENLLADLWQPVPSSTRSGLGLVYLHGSGWRVGDKDIGTRPFFKRLASQGHVVLDVAYSLWPEADLPTMVKEVNQAILWIKENAPEYGVDPEKIVLLGGSAGGHLALLAAYTPGESAFQPTTGEGDTSVCAVIAFYPPIDLWALQKPYEDYAEQSTPRLLEKAADGMMQILFKVEDSHGREDKRNHQNIIEEMLGGRPDEVPEMYRLLSPISHISPQCPPTLLLQGADDVFDLAPGVIKIQARLKESGVPVVWVEFPHTEHGFDLLFPQISPVAQAATYDVERFLAMLV